MWDKYFIPNCGSELCENVTWTVENDQENHFSLLNMSTHNLFHPVITLSHRGPPSDISVFIIRPLL